MQLTKVDRIAGRLFEFVACGYGDCEDYAIAKYFMLIELGFDEDKLFLSRVEDKFSGRMHMVLSYFPSFSQPPLILDNLSFKVLPMNRRDDVKFDLFFNSSGVYEIDETNRLKKRGNRHAKVENC